MGYQDKAYALVSMTNKDVYYIDEETARLLQDMLQEGQPLKFKTFTDARSGSRVTISVGNISSIVLKEADNA